MVRKTRLNPTLFAMLLIEAEIIIFAFQDATIKLLSENFPIWQVVFFRSVVASWLLLTAIWITRGLSSLGMANLKANLMRASMLFVSHIFYYLSIASLPLATAVAINFSAPLFVVLLARPFLGERVSWRRWFAVCLGFLGVLVMVKPGGQLEIGVIFALLASVCFAGVILLTRRLAQSESGHNVAFYSMFFFGIWATLGGVLVAWLDLPMTDHPGIRFLLLPWSEPELPALGLLILIGITAAVGHLFFALAYQHAEASLLAPLEYTYIAFAALLGFVIWGEIPSIAVTIGALIVIASGIYLALQDGR